MANGISFLLKLPEFFQFPAESRHLLSTVALSMVTMRSPIFASFSHSVQETCPALNFFSGYAILFTRSSSSNVKD